MRPMNYFKQLPELVIAVAGAWLAIKTITAQFTQADMMALVFALALVVVVVWQNRNRSVGS